MPITVPYKELHDSYNGLSGLWDDSGPSRIRTYLVAWEDSTAFASQMRGGSTYSGSFGSGTWSRVLPMQDPQDPSIYCRSLAWRPEGAITGHDPVTYSHVVFTAMFRRPDNAIQPFDVTYGQETAQSFDNQTYLPYCTQSLSFGSEFYDVDVGALRFTDGSEIKTPIGRRVQIVDMVFQFHQLPFMPLPYMRRFADSINSTPFMGCPAETVYFVGGESQRGANEDGSPNQEVTLHFKWRAQSWQKFLRSDGSWDNLNYANGLNYLPYATQDLGKLLFSNPQ